MRAGRLPVREGVFPGGLPYLAAGSGPPLVYLCGSTPNHTNPPPGVQRALALRTWLKPLASRGRQVFFTNRWPGMQPGTTFAEVAERHAQAIERQFGEPVDVLGHSTGGSLILQLVADRPDVVRRAVAASAAYTLGPIARRAQRVLIEELERTGGYTPRAMVAMMEGMVRRRWVAPALTPLFALAAPRIRVASPSDAIAMLRAEDGFDLRDRLPSIRVETLVICGARDYYWTPEMFAETAFRMPAGTLIMYPNAGHAVITDRRFADDVLGFLDAPTPRAGA